MKTYSSDDRGRSYGCNHSRYCEQGKQATRPWLRNPEHFRRIWLTTDFVRSLFSVAMTFERLFRSELGLLDVFLVDANRPNMTSAPAFDAGRSPTSLKNTRTPRTWRPQMAISEFRGRFRI